ncbi:MAG TPA: tetratricopeptide repeat protein [Candidatus Udaeobacter sp.]|nr:tetratricopeptide repeat protein [Candidatus Udaeobacter sp.]
MDSNLDFRFSVPDIPQGEALTFDEVEERCLKQLQEKDGKCVQSLINLAKLYSQAKLHDKAFRCVERLIALSDDPEEHGAYYLALGGFMEKIGDYQGAVGFYRQALALEPCQNKTWYFIHNNLGYSLHQLADYGGAIAYLRRAIEINPRLPNAYKNLGLAFEAKGNFEEAAELFVAATQANASDSRSLAHLENLIASHPELQIDLPDLPTRIDACREAVKIARAQQPDLRAMWVKDRKRQKGR